MIRAVSFFHYRNYVWLLPLYIVTILISWFAIAEGYCVSCLPDCSECPKCEVVVKDTLLDSLHFEADYLVITYQFNREGGMDLDTRTQIISPTISSKLGFCLNNNGQDSSLYWSGDNTGYGVESCVVDLNRFGQQDRVVIQCDAFWYKKRNSGKMSIDIKAFKGGTMELKNFQFFNSGGELTANLRFEDAINTRKHACIGGERIGLINYDKSIQKLSFEKQ